MKNLNKMEKEQTDYFAHLPKLITCQDHFAWTHEDKRLLSSKTFPEATIEAKEKYNEKKNDLKKMLIDLENSPYNRIPYGKIPEMEAAFPKEIIITQVTKHSISA